MYCACKSAKNAITSRNFYVAYVHVCIISTADWGKAYRAYVLPYNVFSCG